MSKKHSAAVGALAAALLLAAPTVLRAQEHLVGLKGSINLYDVRLSESVEGVASVSSKRNWAGGLYAAFGLSEVIGIQLEALYSRRAFGAEDPVDGVNAELRTGYLQFPALLTARIPLAGTGLRPLLYAGPMVSLESACDLHGTMEGVSASVDCDDPEIDFDRATTDWSVLLGGGIEYPVGAIVLGAEVRYSLGLTNLNGDPQTRDEQSVRSKMWEFMVALGVPIQL